MIAVNGKNHATLISDPEPAMAQLIQDFLKVGENGEETYDAWLQKAKIYGQPGKARMLVDPGKGAAGIEGDFKTFFGHLVGSAEKPMEGWQQFVVCARDERGDPVTDYLIEVLREDSEGNWKEFEQMYTDVHAYTTDPSFRCFHIRLPENICDGRVPLKVRINASTGTELMAYQGYGSDDDGKTLTATAKPVEIALNDMGDSNASLFHPFTTTLVEIVLNREPSPLDKVSRIFQFLEPAKTT
jgi:hypothetical protein